MAGGQLLESFRILKRIAVGGFGVVDEGIGPNGEQVAIKRELASDKVTRPILEHEYHVYKALEGPECILNARVYGRQNKFNVMVMDLLGPSLSDRFHDCAKRFSLKTTARLGIGMLDAVEHIHTRGFIHRDIKPENFLLGFGPNARVIHPVDFGLVRRWGIATPGASALSSRVGEEAGVIGTLPYASVHSHLGLEQTRRDDLHSLTYTILLFARGNLPWEKIRGGTRKHCARRTLEKKRSWTAARLCQNLPHELQEFSGYCFSLDVNQTPDYKLLRSKLTVLAEREGWNPTSKFEWEEPDWKASTVLEPPPRSKKPPFQPLLKRGDIVLLKISPEKTLDYEPLPRVLDASFFPHQAVAGAEAKLPYRPAIIRKVIVDENDDTYFRIEVFPLTQKNDLEGLSKRRTISFRPLNTLINDSARRDSRLEGFYAYKTTLVFPFLVEYSQASDVIAQLSIPEQSVTELESELATIPTPYSLVYDSDDDQTHTIRRRLPRAWSSGNHVVNLKATDLSEQKAVDITGINGWISDLIFVEELKDRENGGTGVLDSDLDSDSDSDVEFWDWPQPINRRSSCTIRESDQVLPHEG